MRKQLPDFSQVVDQDNERAEFLMNTMLVFNLNEDTKEHGGYTTKQLLRGIVSNLRVTAMSLAGSDTREYTRLTNEISLQEFIELLAIKKAITYEQSQAIHTH